MQTPKLAVIAAAGLGSRLGLSTVKCLVEIHGKTLIERLLDLLRNVPQVRVVVGYQEADVVEHVRRIRDDVIFVRNAHYDSSSLQESLRLAVRHWDGPFLAIEGDVVFEPTSFANFLDTCDSPGVLGITGSSTDDALYVDTISDDGDIRVTGFRRDPVQQYEWTGLGYLDKSWLDTESKFAYQALEPHLPLRAVVTPAFEIDTPADMTRAQAVLRTGRWSTSSEERFGLAQPEWARSFS